MMLSDLIKRAQMAMNKEGEKLSEDGAAGPKTLEAMSRYAFDVVALPLPIPAHAPDLGTPPWLAEAKKHEGKKESDSAFNKWLSGFWPKVGLPNYKTIIGTSFAWCGLFVAAMLTQTGQDIVSGAAGAKNWAKFGQEINWKQDGIPQGAIVQINHSKCGSGSSNHVAMANGNCTAKDLLKPGAYIALYGGNQSNAARVSRYSVTEICAVRWPNESQKPAPVTVSKDCATAGTTGGYTR